MRQVLHVRARLNPFARERWLAFTDPLETLRDRQPYAYAYGRTKSAAFARLYRQLTETANLTTT